MDAPVFTITSFQWMQQVERRLAAADLDSDSDQVIITKLSSLAKFLDAKKLTRAPLLSANENIGRDFVLRSDQLTEKGIEFIRQSFEKWQRQAKSPDDIRPLEKIWSKMVQM